MVVCKDVKLDSEIVNTSGIDDKKTFYSDLLFFQVLLTN